MKILDQNIDKEWYEEFCEASPIFACMPAYALAGKILPLKRQYKGVFNFYFKNKTHWMTLVEDQTKIFNEMLSTYLKDKNYYYKWFLEWKKRTKEYNRIFEKIKKAAAVITNEGGITSHAAIVSRELKKPCIISTRIATKVLKDGDLVEVEADNGIVKILKK